VSDLIPAPKVIDSLGVLKRAAGDFAIRESRLLADHRRKCAVEHHQRDIALRQLDERLAEETAAKERRLNEARDLASARLEARRARIARAQQSATARALQKIQEETDQRRYEIQKARLQAERQRDANIATLDRIVTDCRATSKELPELEISARRTLRVFASLLKPLSDPVDDEPVTPPEEASDAIAAIRSQMDAARAEIEAFRRCSLPRLFRHRWLWLGPILAPLLAAFLLQRTGTADFSLTLAGWCSGIICFAVLVLYGIAHLQATPRIARVVGALRHARALQERCFGDIDQLQQHERERVEREYRTLCTDLDQQWNLSGETSEVVTGSTQQRLAEKAKRVGARAGEWHARALARLEQQHAEAVGQSEAGVTAQKAETTARCADAVAHSTAEFDAAIASLESEWRGIVEPIHASFETLRQQDAALFPDWQVETWNDWAPPASFAGAARLGRLEINLEQFCEALPRDPRLAFPGGAKFSVPMLLTCPEHGSLLLETVHSGRAEAIMALNNLVLRLLSVAPAGRVNFTLIDPVGLGQSFSGLMHLADFEERLINSRVWTQPGQIEEKLGELNEHMEKVIQMYLRNEYATIADYNAQAGKLAEPYHVVVVADFPGNFSPLAARRLASIAASGARCGVHTLIHWDRRQPLPPDFTAEEMQKSSVCVGCTGRLFMLGGKPIPGAELILDTPPATDRLTAFIQKAGSLSRDAHRVEVPFAQVTPDDAQVWSLATTDELRVPVGRTAATKLQYLALGKDTRQHALIAGKTGSGKSTLFHVMITNLALWCSPDQVEFYLIDFKKGVEFKCYATHRLPHARVVAIESDREFGLSVLQRVDEELRRRGDLFRKLGVQSLAAYKQAGGGEPMPRSLLIIDEFQELFVEDDKIAHTASMLLDRIVRQGRAFGIHVLLGSQTLGGAYSVARSTLGQMVVRIALQCNEADAFLIMDDSNPAPRLLSRPGEGIYNDSAGALEGNSPFQVVWLADRERDAALEQVRERARRLTPPPPAPIVFEGNAPADVEENSLLGELLDSGKGADPSAPRIWLGAPNSIKGPTEAVFRRQGGNHLLIVGQRDEAVLSILSVALVSLAAQLPRSGARFLLLDASAPGARDREYLARVAAVIPHGVTLVKNSDLAGTMNELAAELDRRKDDPHAADAPPVFLLIHSLQKFGKLRAEDEFAFSSGGEDAPKPGAQFTRLINEGAALGLHLIVSIDSGNNVNRFLSRKSLSEFEMRVLFQMSANDSALLIDSPKAGDLGLHRALFYNEQEGYTEVFRPYALPAGEWVERAGERLAIRPDHS
jgi:DNA segregation ATPase FtsK/SpoIIIE, S-DNA-T family